MDSSLFRLPSAEYWFEFQDKASVDLVIQILNDLQISEIRTCFSWADWERPGGREWFDWFISRLHDSGVRLVPCLFYTPIHRAMRPPGREPRTSFPPERLLDYTDFVRDMIERYGRAFDWIHLWNEPNWQVYWDQELDPESRLFAEMVRPAIQTCHEAGKNVVLGGLSPYDPTWILRLHEYRILEHVQAIGIHAFPGTWDVGLERRTERPWTGFTGEIEQLRSQLRSLGITAESWYTEVGYSTWHQDQSQAQRERGQIDVFQEAARCSADRVFWHTLLDQRETSETDNVLNMGLPHDARAYHFGIVDGQGRRKPLYAYWKRCVDHLREDGS